jgi:DNA-binding XRE family transcriptional regulator
MHNLAFFKKPPCDRLLAMKAARPQRSRHYLKEWREHLDMTQEVAAPLIGWTQSKLSRIENFQIVLTWDDLLDAAHAYGRKPMELVYINPKVEQTFVETLDRVPEASAGARKQITDYAEFVLEKDKGD